MNWSIFLQIVGFGTMSGLLLPILFVSLIRHDNHKNQNPTIVLAILAFIFLIIGALGTSLR